MRLQGFTPLCELDDEDDDLALLQRIAQARVIGGSSLGDLVYNAGGRDDERHRAGTFLPLKPIAGIRSDWVRQEPVVIQQPTPPEIYFTRRDAELRELRKWGGFPYDPALLKRAGVCDKDIALLTRKYRSEP